jgi:hypothetical protein
MRLNLQACRRAAAAGAVAGALACAVHAQAQVTAAGVADTLATVASRLPSPPGDARPLVRWWWFGPALEQRELEREIVAMKAGGFGGFEIQPVYPMELDDPDRGIRTQRYLSPDFLGMLAFANQKAREHGLRVDVTLSSGWPYGGPHVPVTEAASRLRPAVIELPANADSFAMPALMHGEKLLATFVADGGATQYDPEALKLIEVPVASGRAAIAPSAHGRVIVCYITSRTGQQVKRAALGGEGFVLDHLNATAVRHHLDAVAGPLLNAFGASPPYSVFSDSLEVYASDWTDDFLAEFQRRRGYDLKPHLPQIDSGKGPDAPALRHDWALTQTELVNERYLEPVKAWAHAHGTRFRSQTYGEPAVSMSSNRLVDLPEGEGPQFRSFSFTRWATSAGHLYGRPVISAETWTWLHSPAFAATPLDMKAEADRMLLQGVNQFVGHGWPYTPPGVPEPGYGFYAAAVFNDHLPWWNVMPDVTAYLQRMSYLMRQGQPAKDVAVFLPSDDVYASLEPGKVSLSAEMGRYVTPELTAQILDAGHNLDYVDAESVAALGIPYPVLVMPRVSRLAPAVLAKLAEYVRGGGRIIAVGSQPSLAPGYADAARVTPQVVAASKALFASGQNVRFVASDADVGAALQAAVPADLRLSAHASDIGFVHRKLADADIYLIVNTSNRDVRASASFHAPRRWAAWWNPFNGDITPAPAQPVLELAPYESRVLVFSDTTQQATAHAKPVALVGDAVLVADLGRGWQLSFPVQAGPDGAAPMELAALRSWTEDPARRYFSGVATYERTIDLTAPQLDGRRVLLDFGPGTPLDAVPKVPAGMRAMLDSPVREAAVVAVNGQRAGSIWHPPYVLDVTALLRPGANRFEIHVANSALNARAGQALPDYRLLSARYGERFIPQDTQLIQPQPSGILGQVRLMGERIQ